MQAEPGRDLAHLARVGLVEQGVVDAVVGDVDPGRVGAEHADQLVPGGLGRDDQPGGPAGRGADRRLVERRGHRAVRVRLGEERQVVHGHHDGHAGAQRHRVVRRVDDVGADLLRDERQPALLPGQPGRPVRDGGGAATILGAGHQPPVPLLVGALAGHGQVGPGRPQGAHQTVNVTADAHRGPRAQRSRQQAHEAPRPVRLPSSLAPARGVRDRRQSELCSGCPVSTERTPSAVAPRPRRTAARAAGRRRSAPAHAAWERRGRAPRSLRASDGSRAGGRVPARPTAVPRAALRGLASPCPAPPSSWPGRAVGGQVAALQRRLGLAVERLRLLQVASARRGGVRARCRCRWAAGWCPRLPPCAPPTPNTWARASGQRRRVPDLAVVVHEHPLQRGIRPRSCRSLTGTRTPARSTAGRRPPAG